MDRNRDFWFNLNQIWVCALMLVSTLLWFSEAIDKTYNSRFLTVFVLVIVYAIVGWKQLVTNLFSKFSFLDVALFGFVTVQVLSISWSTNVAQAFSSSFRDVALLLVYFILKSVYNSDKRWKRRLPILVSYVFSAYLVVTWYQLIALAQQNGLDTQTVYLLKYPTETKNLASSFILVISAFSTVVALTEKGKSRALAICNLIVAIITLFLFSTRGISLSIVGVGLVLGAIMVVKKPFKAKIGYLLAFGFLALGVSHWFSSNYLKTVSLEKYVVVEKDLNLDDFDDKADDHQYRSSNERLGLWAKTLLLIRQEPILGVGAGNWQIEYPRNGLDGLERAELRVTSFKRPHNELLSILSETGIVGLLLIIGVIGFFVFGIQLNQIGLVYLLGMTAFSVSAMFDFPRERMEHQLLFALLLVSNNQNKTAIKVSKRWAKPAVLAMIALSVLGSVVYYKRYEGEKNYEQLRVLKNQEQYQECLAHIEKVESFFYTVDWVNYPFRWFAGMCYTYQQQFEKGEVQFREALKLNPGNFHTHNNLGFCLAQQGKYAQSVPHFKRCLEINKQFEDARFNLAFTYTMLKQFADAKAILSENVRNSDKKTLYMSRITEAERSAVD